MARRSDYPFHKSDTKFGTNLIASLFSIPISLGAKAMIDGLSTLPNDMGNDSSNKLTSERLDGPGLAVGAIFTFTLLALGIYFVCTYEDSFLGGVLIFFSVPMLLYGIYILASQNFIESRIEEDIEYLRANYCWKDIDDDIQKVFHQSLNIELFFHFTRPLLTETEYRNIESRRFKKNLKTYQDYKEAWNRFYWNYSFQIKVNDALKEAVCYMMDYSLTMSEPEYYDFVHKYMKAKLNYAEKQCYKVEVQTIQGIEKCFAYTFMVNNILPYKDEEKELSRRLSWDLKNRRENFLKEIYRQYGGDWKPELLNQLDVWRCI